MKNDSKKIIKALKMLIANLICTLAPKGYIDLINEISDARELDEAIYRRTYHGRS